MDKQHRHKRIIRKRELRERIGYSDAHIWRLEKAGKFPQRVRLGPYDTSPVGWVESEVEAWLDERINAREATA